MLGLLIIWAMYRNTDPGELWNIAKSGNFAIIDASLIFGLIGNIFRGLRWELFVNSLGYSPPRSSLVYATLGNYAVNFVLPRAGDLWRCGVVSKYDKMPFSKTFETFLVDKVVDIVAGVSIILISIALYIDFFASYLNNNPQLAENISNIFNSVWMHTGLVVLIVTVVLMFTVFKRTVFIRKTKVFLKTVKYDLKLISGMKEKKLIFIYTILIWLCFYLYFYICFFEIGRAHV